MAKILKLLVPAAVLIAGAISLAVQLGSTNANKIVDEADLEGQTAVKLTQDGAANFKAWFTDPNLNGLPGNRAKLQEPAKINAEIYANAATHWRLGAAKYDEAAKQFVKAPAIDLWRLKSQQFTKMAEAVDALHSVVLLVDDPKVDSAKRYGEAMAPLNKIAAERSAEARALTAQAEKFIADHPGMFE